MTNTSPLSSPQPAPPPQNLAILHPGAMGIFVAASAQNAGHKVHWLSQGRSIRTRNRASEHNLIEMDCLDHLCDTCSIIISVCPPHAAEEMAHQIVASAYRGIYVDANAISPQRARRIGLLMKETDITFVDGGIIGGPVWKPEEHNDQHTWLYLAGNEETATKTVADIFHGSPLSTSIIGNTIGQASALKMCYAAYTKGTTALLATIIAAAESMEVREQLHTQWERDFPNLYQQAVNRTRRVTAKAWRFAGEMQEISATFAAAGLPGEFHMGAYEIYHRMASFKNAPETPDLDTVLQALIKDPDISKT